MLKFTKFDIGCPRPTEGWLSPCQTSQEAGISIIVLKFISQKLPVEMWYARCFACKRVSIFLFDLVNRAFINSI